MAVRSDYSRAQEYQFIRPPLHPFAEGHRSRVMADWVEYLRDMSQLAPEIAGKKAVLIMRRRREQTEEEVTFDG